MVGCREAEPASGPEWDDDACSTLVVPSAFGLSWERANHRISEWAVGVESEDERSCEADTLAATYVGGDWTSGDVATDTPSVAARIERVQATPEVLGVGRARIALDVDAGGEARVRTTVDREPSALQGYAHLTPIILAVRFDTDVPQRAEYPEDYDPALGYTSRGLGVRASMARSSDTSFDVQVDARFAHGPSDRPDMNLASSLATSRVTVDVLVVGTTVSPVTGSVAYAIEHPKQNIGEDPEHPRADPALRRIELDGAPGAPRGLVGFSSFWFELSDIGPCGPRQECPRGDVCEDGVCTSTYGPPGFYIREIAADARIVDYDQATGRATLDIDGYASNSSQAFAFYAMRTDFSADVVWFQLQASEPIEIEQAFETGSTRIPLVWP